MKNIFLILLISLFILSPLKTTSEIKPPPETLKEAQNLGERILRGFPATLNDAWRESNVIWSKMFYWARDIWNKYPGKWIESIWNQISEKFNNFTNRKTEEIRKIIN